MSKQSPKKSVPKKSAPSVTKRKAVNAKIDPDSGIAKKLSRRDEGSMRAGMKERRDVFVEEYLVDFTASRAWLRMKARLDPDDDKEYTSSEAANYGYLLTREPYVAKRISDALDEIAEGMLLRRNRVVGGMLREANREGLGSQHAARVSAFSRLLEHLEKMEDRAERARQKEAQSKKQSSGVMLVPAMGTVDQWEAATMAAQAKLKAEVDE